MSEEYIKPGRVLIAIQIVFIPLYFFALTNALPAIAISLIPTSILNITVRIVIPIIFSIPFVVFSFYQRYEISEAYEHMGETVWNLPNSIKVFYGFNFLALILFGLPFIAPVIAVSGGYFLGLLIMGKKDEVVQIGRPIIKFFTLIFLPVWLFLTIVFYSQVGEFFIYLINLWGENIDFIYLSSLNIANGALVSGAILSFIEYFQQDSYSKERQPIITAIVGLLTFISLELFLIYFIYFTEEGLTGTQLLVFIAVNVIGFILSIVVILLKWSLRKEHTEEGTGLLGWFTIFIFQFVNILSSQSVALFSRTFAIILTSLIFILLFISSYNKALKYI